MSEENDCAEEVVSDALEVKTECCSGSIKILHANKKNLGDFNNLFLSANGGINKDGTYPKLKRGFFILSNDIIIKMEVIGKCCWEVYENPKFEGEIQYLYHGEHFPKIQPTSIRKVLCHK